MKASMKQVITMRDDRCKAVSEAGEPIPRVQDVTFDPHYARRMADAKIQLSDITGDPESYLVWAQGGN